MCIWLFSNVFYLLHLSAMIYYVNSNSLLILFTTLVLRMAQSQTNVGRFYATNVLLFLFLCFLILFFFTLVYFTFLKFLLKRRQYLTTYSIEVVFLWTSLKSLPNWILYFNQWRLRSICINSFYENINRYIVNYTNVMLGDHLFYLYIHTLTHVL